MHGKTRVPALIALAAAAGCAGAQATPAHAPPGFAGAPAGERTLGASSSAVVVDAQATGATISADVLGANMALWYDITLSGLSTEFTAAGLHLVRWPGGSDSDVYHWQTHTMCAGGYANPNSTFDHFMQDVAQPARLDVAVTVNYGSNPACNGGGDPAEAAAWVDYANNAKHYGVKFWTVGNEAFGSWEYDLHPKPHDPATYAGAVASGYYPAIKAKDATAQVGVVVEGSAAWDQTVLKQAKYDFVEFHFYAQGPGHESDDYLLHAAPQAFASSISALRSEMTSYGVPSSVPIYVGELGSVYANPGKQTTSITQSLFAGMVIAELMKAGVPRASWWLGNGGCSDSSNGNFSPSLYGWQNFGGYMIFSDGVPEYGCPNATPVARGTLLPTARAYQVLGAFGHDGERMLRATVPPALHGIRAYGATLAGGYGVLLFNLEKAAAASVTLQIAHASKTSFAATQLLYGKHVYDASRSNQWLGPATKNLGTVGTTFSVTLPAWSVSAVTLR